MNQMRISRNALWSLCSLLLLAGSAIAAAPAARPSQRLLQEMAASNDLRDFATSAMSRPGEGGIFYASYVANICGRDFEAIKAAGKAAIAKEVAPGASASTSRLALMADLPRRCSSFATGEASEMVRSLKDRAQTSGDPLVAAEQDLLAAWRSGRPELLRAAVGHLMQLDDPLLWTEHRLYSYVAQFDPEAKKATGLFLNGKVYTDADGLRYLEASTALELGFCKRGLPCGPDDVLQVVCASAGNCPQDRDAKAKDYLLANGGSEDNWKNVLALMTQIQAALASRNVAFFVR